MKICLVADSLDIGGAERHVIDLARGLQRRGHAVTIACSTSGPLEAHLAGTSVDVVPLLGAPVKRRVSPNYALRLRALFATRSYDVVHAHMFASQAGAAVATLDPPTPLILTQHSEERWQRWWHRRAASWYRRRAVHIIGVSNAICQGIVEQGEIPACRVSLVPNAPGPLTDVDRACNPDAMGREASPRRRVGIVGRLTPEKGHAVLIDAVARVAPTLPDARFLLVGDGPLAAMLTERIERLGLHDQVRLCGAYPSARGIIAGLDLLVVPSLTEGSPLVVAEALAAGVPVLASHVGDIPERIKPGRNGNLVPPGDPDALAAALLDLLADGRLAALGGRPTGADSGHDTLVGRVEAVYRAVLNEHA